MFKSLISSLLLFLMLFSQFYNSAVWLKYELNVEEITELFCINKEKPALQCHGKCHVKKELIKIDIPPASTQAPVTEVSYLPAIKLYVVEETIEVAIGLSNFLALNPTSYSAAWESTIPEPPYIPPRA